MRGDRFINIFSLCQKGRSAMKKILLTALLFSLMVCGASPVWAGGLDDCKAYQAGEKAYKDKGEAIRLYTEAIESCKLSGEDLSKVYYSRGKAWVGKGDYGKAIADFTKAIEINPKNADAYHNRGAVRCDKKDYDKAIADFTKAIELDPKNYHAYYSRSYNWSLKGDHAKAKADDDKSKELRGW
jgi:tetratricopeptide (TPR) repeat protein